MERMHVTYDQAMHEPAYVIELGFMLWELDAKRARLKTGNQNN